jgi:hypothetical protein
VGRAPPFAIASLLAAVLIAGCASRTAAPSSSSTQPGAAATPATASSASSLPPSTASDTPSTAASTSAPVAAHVAPCPVPALDYAGTPYSPQAAPATTNVPALPAGAQVFGTAFVPGSLSYLLGPASATCQAAFASADGGESMVVTSVADHSAGVTMVIRAGGVGPSTDLACPYIPAVYAADKAFRQGQTFCGHPSADVIRQIPTGTASLYAAAVLVPAGVKDPNLHGSGGTDPTVALYTAQVSQNAANGQLVACTLASAEGNVCAASLKFFLATQAYISAKLSAANLSTMEAALASFLAEPQGS